jgi:hypothetical protein
VRKSCFADQLAGQESFAAIGEHLGRVAAAAPPATATTARRPGCRRWCPWWRTRARSCAAIRSCSTARAPAAAASSPSACRPC